jgi:hypothetical protein
MLGKNSYEDENEVVNNDDDDDGNGNGNGNGQGKGSGRGQVRAKYFPNRQHIKSTSPSSIGRRRFGWRWQRIRLGRRRRQSNRRRTRQRRRQRTGRVGWRQRRGAERRGASRRSSYGGGGSQTQAARDRYGTVRCRRLRATLGSCRSVDCSIERFGNGISRFRYC